jgi:hypothetical protein
LFGAFHGIERPGPGVFVIVDIVSELMETENVVEIIPGDAAQRKLPDHSADDDAKFLVRGRHSELRQQIPNRSRRIRGCNRRDAVACRIDVHIGICRPFSGTTSGQRAAIHFQRSSAEIQNPIFTYTAGGVNGGFATTVTNARIADLNDQDRLGRMFRSGAGIIACEDGNIRFRIRIASRPERRLDSNAKTLSKRFAEVTIHKFQGHAVRHSLRRHFDDAPLNQLDALIFKKTEIDQTIIFLARPSARGWLGGVDASVWRCVK